MTYRRFSANPEVERSNGKFLRRLPLGFDVDPDKVAATFDDGVLSVRIPKPPEVETQAKKRLLRLVQSWTSCLGVAQTRGESSAAPPLRSDPRWP